MDLRTLMIIKLLLHSETNLTIEMIAEKLDLSERTIYKELTNVKAELRKFHLSLISKSKEGVHIEGTLENIVALKEYVETNRVDTEWNAKNRVDMLCLMLLSEQEVMKATSMSVLLNVSVATIRNDLKDVETKLKSYHLNLTSKKGEGYLVEGEYIQMAALATNIFMTYIDDSTFYGIFQKNKEYPSLYITKILKEYGYLDILKRLRTRIGDILITGFNTLSDVKFEELVMMIMQIIQYHKTGKLLEMDHLKETLDEKTKTYTNLIKEALEMEFHIVLKQYEITYLQWMIYIHIQNKIVHQETETRWYFVNKTKELILLFERRMKMTLDIENDFYDMVVEHLFGAVSRAKGTIYIQNPLRSDIEKNYSEILKEVDACLKIVFPEYQFSQDEISFLTLYFAAAVEKSTQRVIDALIVCTSGMGSSKMLESRLEKEIPEINIRKTVSLMQLEQEELENYDFIFSTVPIDLSKDLYMTVSPLLSDKEIIKIKNLVKEKHHHKTTTGKFYSTILESDAKNSSITDLEKMVRVIQFGQQLIEDLCILGYKPSQFKVEDIKERLIAYDFLHEEDDIHMNEIIQIPKTQIGYMEIERKETKVPSLVMLIMENDQYQNALRAVIVMIYSKHVNEFMMDVLSIVIETIAQEMRIFLKRMDYEDVMKKTIEKSVKRYLLNNFLKEV